MSGNADFESLINLIKDGDLVNASVANRPVSQIHSLLLRLRELFQAHSVGEATFARAKVCESAVMEGQAVYFNEPNQRFERALGSAELDAEFGYFRTAAKAQLWGIVYRKLTATTADILLSGAAYVSLTDSIDGDVSPGRVYYLSNSVAGMLQEGRPPVGVPVLVAADVDADDRHYVLVNSRFVDILESHHHYSYRLACRPSGTHTEPANSSIPHTIGSPNTSIEGWLPANHASFGGLAPAGAKFGYNIAASPLQYVWPPQPASSAFLEFDLGEQYGLFFMGVPMGLNRLCQIDENGIWWMSSYLGQVPWPQDWTAAIPEPDLETQFSPYMSLRLSFSKPSFGTTNAWVSSLTANPESGLVITDATTGLPAQTGNLRIGYSPEQSIAEGDDTTGHLVFKDRNEAGQFLRGPVVEGIKVTGPNVTVSSDAAADGGGYYPGKVHVDIDTDLEGHEIMTDVLRLDGAEQSFYKDIPSINFPAGRASRVYLKFDIPADATLVVGNTLALQLWILNRSATNVPAHIFSLRYKKWNQPTTVLTAPASWTSLAAVPAAPVTISAVDQYFLRTSESMAVTAGSVIVVELSRGASDGFAGDLHVLRHRGIYTMEIPDP